MTVPTEFDFHLQRDFPTILKQHEVVDVPDGWQRLTLDLLTKLEAHAKCSCPELRVEQVKSKYAALRCYLSGSDQHADAIVREAELESANLCETCGEPGKCSRRGRGWIEVMCPKHKAESEQETKEHTT